MKKISIFLLLVISSFITLAQYDRGGGVTEADENQSPTWVGIVFLIICGIVYLKETEKNKNERRRIREEREKKAKEFEDLQAYLKKHNLL